MKIPSLRTFSVLYLVFVIAIFLSTFFTPVPDISLRIISLVCCPLIIGVIFFSSANFEFVKNRSADFQEAGPATVEKKKNGMSIVSLGTPSLTNQAFQVKLKELPHASAYLGRWDVYYYYEENCGIVELWQDHLAFGNNWYYIRYEKENK
jgi:hypothetical protein